MMAIKKTKKITTRTYLNSRLRSVGGDVVINKTRVFSRFVNCDSLGYCNNNLEYLVKNCFKKFGSPLF